MQDIHRLNAEMWHNVSEALWRRWFIAVAIYFLTTKVFKSKYMN